MTTKQCILWLLACFLSGVLGYTMAYEGAFKRGYTQGMCVTYESFVRNFGVDTSQPGIFPAECPQSAGTIA